MKKKKKVKKNARKNHNYNGKNIFGQRCTAEVVKLEGENDLERLFQLLNNVEKAKREGRNLEYTVDCSALPKEEVIKLNYKLDKIARLRSYHVTSDYFNSWTK